MKTKIFLQGPLLTRSGYGEQARFALRALRSREDIFDIYIQPISWGKCSWLPFQDDEKKWIDKQIEKTVLHIQGGGQFDVTLQVTVPNEWVGTRPSPLNTPEGEPPRLSLAPINIGYTAGIETTRVAHQWIQLGNLIDKIIVVSNHSKKVFESSVYDGFDEATGAHSVLKLETPVSAVNYPAKVFKDLPDLDLHEIETEFNFISIAQFGPRKNLPNTIRWFIEEFHDEDVGFVIKTNMAKNSLMDRENCEGALRQIVNAYPDRKCKIYMLHGDLTDIEMHALYKHPKSGAFICLPHGEGFGLPFFEAAYSGLPVIAPGWSGQMDFLCDEKGKEHFYNVAFDLQQVQDEVVWDGVLIKDSAWAYAREASAKNKMRECYNDVLENKGIASRAKKYAKQLHKRFDEKKLYAEFIDAMELQLDTEWLKQLSEIEML